MGKEKLGKVNFKLICAKILPYVAVCTIILIFLGLGGCADTKSQDTSGVITREEYDWTIHYYEVVLNESEEEVTEVATDTLMQREALYLEAKNHGYTATEEEIDEYIEQQKEIWKAANETVLESTVGFFDTEDEYWEYEKKECEKNLPVSDYVNDLNQSTGEEQEQLMSDWSDDVRAAWDEGYTQFQEALAKEKADIITIEAE